MHRGIAVDNDPPSTSPLHELTGLYLAVDCRAPGCNGERRFAVAELANFYGKDRTVGEILRRMRCSGACGGRVEAAWLETGQTSTQGSGRGGVPLCGRRRGSRGRKETNGIVGQPPITPPNRRQHPATTHQSSIQ